MNLDKDNILQGRLFCNERVQHSVKKILHKKDFVAGFIPLRGVN